MYMIKNTSDSKARKQRREVFESIKRNRIVISVLEKHKTHRYLLGTSNKFWPSYEFTLSPDKNTLTIEKNGSNKVMKLEANNVGRFKIDSRTIFVNKMQSVFVENLIIECMSISEEAIIEYLEGIFGNEKQKRIESEQ